MTLHNPQATEQALNLVRSGDPFQWYVITFVLIVLYIYQHEFHHGNIRNIYAGLALYMVHWLVEIINALIQYSTGHALWTVPTGTAFSILIGVCIEINLMFAIAGIVAAQMLPKDRNKKILGLHARWLVILFNAAAASILEIFFVQTPTFVWVYYPWWGPLQVFITVYVPFYWAAVYCHDAPEDKARKFIGILLAINVAAMILFSGILGWI